MTPRTGELTLILSGTPLSSLPLVAAAAGAQRKSLILASKKLTFQTVMKLQSRKVNADANQKDHYNENYLGREQLPLNTRWR